MVEPVGLRPEYQVAWLLSFMINSVPRGKNQPSRKPVKPEDFLPWTGDLFRQQESTVSQPQTPNQMKNILLSYGKAIKRRKEKERLKKEKKKGANNK